MAKRLSKSSIDWVKFAQTVSKFEKSDFNVFKGRSEYYLRCVLEYPEQPPAIDWNSFKALVSDKSVVDRLEKSYKAFTVPYPKTSLALDVDAQQRLTEDRNKIRMKYNLEAIEEAKELMEKFKIMIPFHEMTYEEFALTFPKWATWYGSKAIPGESENNPTLTEEERAELSKSDGRPWSIS